MSSVLENSDKQTKYVFVTGGVMSAVGKGITTASIAKILQSRGFNVGMMKIDPYINADAGTMNPVMHGEVFVTDDGGEIDMDIGTYERFLDVNLSKQNNLTTGQIYTSVINKERRGDFLGQCVQIIPHVTDEIKYGIRSIAEGKAKKDIGIVELGGTVGDIEGLPYIEAVRQMGVELGYNGVAYVHVTWVPVLDVVGEQKTKPTQHSVQELRRMGIQPNFIIARSTEYLSQEPKRKVALFSNVQENRVFSSPDLKSIYEVPVELDKQGLGKELIDHLKLENDTIPNSHWETWQRNLEKALSAHLLVRIALAGKYAKLADSYVSVNESLKIAGYANDAHVELDWIETELFEQDPSNCKILSRFDGLLVPGGFGSRGTEGKIAALHYARENKIPTLGVCFGFQFEVVEYSRHIGLEKANSTEIDPDTQHPVIDLMPEQKDVETKGATMRLGAHEITLKPGTTADRLYGGQTKVKERHRHRYEVNPNYHEKLQNAGVIFSGSSDHGRRMEFFELPTEVHPFYFGMQGHGEFKTRFGKPSPPYFGLIQAALKQRLG